MPLSEKRRRRSRTVWSAERRRPRLDRCSSRRRPRRTCRSCSTCTCTPSMTPSLQQCMIVQLWKNGPVQPMHRFASTRTRRRVVQLPHGGDRRRVAHEQCHHCMHDDHCAKEQKMCKVTNGAARSRARARAATSKSARRLRAQAACWTRRRASAAPRAAGRRSKSAHAQISIAENSEFKG